MPHEHQTDALDDWVSQYIDEIPGEVRRVIGLATHCLNYGTDTFDDEDWADYPGFSASVRLIGEALEDLDDLWIDTDADIVLTRKPEGELVENEEFDPDDPDSGPEVWVEPDWSSIRLVTRKELVREILGPLAEYVF
jgi:hypothetical protein